MIKVKDHGVVGDGTKDGRRALQNLINAADGEFYFSPGRYRINDMPNFPHRTGYHIIGAGMAQAAPEGGFVTGARAALVWGGTSTDDCTTTIYVDGGLSADSCVFGYAWIRFCDTCVHLDGANATMFTFRYVHPMTSTDVFKVTGGGRIYVGSLNVVNTGNGGGTILDISGDDLANSFYHINGLTGDGNVSDYHLLKNDDNGDGLTYVRFTNAHLTVKTGFDARIMVDRFGSTNGQTVVETVGCRGLSAMAGNVLINGASVSKKSRLIVRDSELDDGTVLVPVTCTSHYTDNRIKNWQFGSGLESGTEYP